MPIRSTGIVQRESGTLDGIRRASSRTSVLATTLKPRGRRKGAAPHGTGFCSSSVSLSLRSTLASHSKAGKFRVVFYASLSPSTRSASMSFVRNRSGFECSRALAATASRKARSNSY